MKLLIYYGLIVLLFGKSSLAFKIPSSSISSPNGVTEATVNPVDRRILIMFEFDSNTLKADLKWSDNSMKTVELQKVSNEFCFYGGSFDDEPESVVLLTGCENKLKSIQIQSQMYGDTLGTTMTGYVEIVQGVDLSGDIVSNNPSSVTNTEENSHGKRKKRGSYVQNQEYLELLDSIDRTIMFDDLDDDDIPKALSLRLNTYQSKSWMKDVEENNSAKEMAKALLFHAKPFFNHPSLKIKIHIEDHYIDIDEDFVPTINGLNNWINVIPTKYQKNGTVHMLLTTKPGSISNGIAKISSVCNKSNKDASGIVKWNKSAVQTAQTLAHEVAHTLGIYHDFEKRGDMFVKGLKRDYTCGAKKNEGHNTNGKNNSVMNYGIPRKSDWSKCSNQDFRDYYESFHRSNQKFCLKEVNDRDRIQYLEFLVMSLTRKVESLEKPTVNCQWTSWGSWQSCSVSCGGGIKKRTRSKSVQAQNGGLDCLGDHQESQNCGEANCPGINCPPGWTKLSGTCYFFYADWKTFSEAESVCRNKGGKLAEPKDQNTNKILNDAAKSKLDYYWIGIKEVGNSWKWASDGSTVAWINWYPGQPDESKSYPRCVLMVGGDEKRWDEHCSRSYYYICEL